jgi:hypothetical protein
LCIKAAAGPSVTRRYEGSFLCYLQQHQNISIYSHESDTAPFCIYKTAADAAPFRIFEFVEEEEIVVPPTPTYDITYMPNGGTGTSFTKLKYENENFTFGYNPFTLTGYVLDNWNTREDGTGTGYKPGSVYKTDSDVTVYACWAKEKYPITYVSNLTGYADAVEYKTYDDAYTIGSNPFSRPNSTVLSWNTAADGTGTSYKPGDLYEVNQPLTLKAQSWAWTGKEITAFSFDEPPA